MTEKWNILLVNLFYILKFKFYHFTEGHTFSFWYFYTRYDMLINDRIPVEFSHLMPLLQLPLETTNRFQLLTEIDVNLIKKNIFIPFQFSAIAWYVLVGRVESPDSSISWWGNNGVISSITIINIFIWWKTFICIFSWLFQWF